MELWQRFGDLHPKLVQFPLVLLLSGLVFDVMGLIGRDRRFHWAAALLSGGGTVALLFAFVCGIYAETWAGRVGVPQDPIEWHEFLANVASWGFVVLTAWPLLLDPQRRWRQLAPYTVLGLCFYVLIGLTAYYGGQLVSPYGLSLNAVAQADATASAAAVDATPDPLQVRLTFTPRRGGALLRPLPVVHEHPMHLTIVSADLAWFDHVHPVLQADGTLQLDCRFPGPGHYLAFAEYMRRGERDQVFQFPLDVGVPAAAVGPADLSPTPAAAEPVAGHPQMTAELVCQPRTPSAGTHAMLLFRLSDRGQPVTDLEPYMGAMGHCAIIPHDTRAFLHCHPEQLFPPHAQSRGGPDIAFRAEFPAPGLYKAWGPFQRGGRLVVADFVVRVEASVLPPRVVNFILND